MKAKMIHRCIHVLDLDASLAFYERALGLAVQRRMGPDDGSWENVFLGNEKTDFQVELTWNRGRTEPYDNGGRDTHLASRWTTWTPRAPCTRRWAACAS